jgi:spore germination cell wall hydrolase CwlJ-like protein
LATDDVSFVKTSTAANLKGVPGMTKKIFTIFIFSLICAQFAQADINDHIVDVEITASVNSGSVEMFMPPSSKEGLSDVECLAVAVYHEARGESTEGQLAVASVILQRVAVPGRWADNVCDVVVPVQFSFMFSENGFNPIENFDAWNKSLAVANHMVTTGPLSEFQNADHYHKFNVTPYWRLHVDWVAQIGAHIFYADPLPAS